VIDEQLLAQVTREWSELVLPGDRRAAKRATDRAVRSYEAGASVAEACEAARRFVSSWSRHPSRPMDAVERALVLTSR
jgi:hypothetical protein